MTLVEVAISQGSWLLTLAGWSLREDFRVQRSPEKMQLPCWFLATVTTSGEPCPVLPRCLLWGTIQSWITPMRVPGVLPVRQLAVLLSLT